MLKAIIEFLEEFCDWLKKFIINHYVKRFFDDLMELYLIFYNFLLSLKEISDIIKLR